MCAEPGSEQRRELGSAAVGGVVKSFGANERQGVPVSTPRDEDCLEGSDVELCENEDYLEGSDVEWCENVDCLEDRIRSCARLKAKIGVSLTLMMVSCRY